MTVNSANVILANVMPELPEVEITRRGLLSLEGACVRACTVRRTDLRMPLPADLPQLLAQQTLKSLQRRGKYLLFVFPQGVMIVHLGMSGVLEFCAPNAPWQKHEHVEWVWQKADTTYHLRFYDPRRFGVVLWQSGTLEQVLLLHKSLAALGQEPLDESYSEAEFYAGLHRSQTSIKAVLLAGKVVVGVGNIYASEALFYAGIRPHRSASRITHVEAAKLLQYIREVLSAAIAAGGSSIKDYRATNGMSGRFQTEYYVYGRAGQPCRKCGKQIVKIVQNQRSSFYCPHCQL